MVVGVVVVVVVNIVPIWPMLLAGCLRILDKIRTPDKPSGSVSVLCALVTVKVLFPEIRDESENWSSM